MNKQNCSVNFNKESLTRNFLTWVLKELLDQKERLCMCSVAHSCLALCHPMDCSLPASSVHGIFQPRLLEWVSMSYSRGSSQPRDWTRISCVSCIGRQVDSLPPCHLGSPKERSFITAGEHQHPWGGEAKESRSPLPRTPCPGQSRLERSCLRARSEPCLPSQELPVILGCSWPYPCSSKKGVAFSLFVPLIDWT